MTHLLRAQTGLFALLAVLLFTGCVTPRPAAIVGPPIDIAEPIDREALLRFLQQQEVQYLEEREYVLSPGDVISIQLVGRPDILSRRETEEGIVVTLSENPTIALPLIGEIMVLGKTAPELQEDLRVAYEEFILDPRPLVLIQFFARNQITVVGSVMRGGKHPYEYGDTVLEALFKAGGLSPGGRGGGMAPGRVLRLYRETLTPRQRSQMSLEEILDQLRVNGEIRHRQEIVIPIDELIFSGTLTYNLPVQPGDILYIPPAGTAYVHGRVRQAGVVFLGPSVGSVTQLLWERGGLRFSGHSLAEVVRTYPDGQQVTYVVDVRRMQRRVDPDFRIRDGDQIFVYGTPLRAAGEWWGDVFNTSIRAGANLTYNPVGP